MELLEGVPLTDLEGAGPATFHVPVRNQRKQPESRADLDQRLERWSL